MKIRYTLSKLDIFMAQQRYSFRSVQPWVLLVLMSGLWFYIGFTADESPQPLRFRFFAGALYGSGLAIVWLVFVALFRAISITTGKLEGIVGEHSLEVTEAGLLETTRFNETLVRWEAFRPTQSTTRHVYIRASDSQWYQVPKGQGFIEGDLPSFVAAIDARVTRSLSSTL